MCAGGKDGKKGVDGRIVREFYERILFGKICKGWGGWADSVGPPHQPSKRRQWVGWVT